MSLEQNSVEHAACASCHLTGFASKESCFCLFCVTVVVTSQKML